MSVAELQSAATAAGAGNSLTHATMTDVPTGTGGTVRVALASPADLAAKAGLTREEYALARVIRSEGYGGSSIGRAAAAVAIGQAIRNGARRSGVSIEEKLTHSIYPGASGLYGEQHGRYASTQLDPTAWTALVAKAVLSDAVPDLARGGDQFIDLKVMAGGVQNGRALRPVESVLRQWMITGGASWKGPIPTVDPFHLVLLGPGGDTQAEREAQLAQLMAIFNDGIAGKHEPDPGDPDDVGGGMGALVALLVAAGGAYLAHAAGWL